MANSSIALKNIPSMHLPIADRVGYSAPEKATATRLSQKQTVLEERRADEPVVTVLIEPNALLREGLRSVLAETRYNPVALASSLEDVGSIAVPEDGVSIFIMDAVENFDDACLQVRAIKDRNPSSRVVMLVDTYDLQKVIAAFHSGRMHI